MVIPVLAQNLLTSEMLHAVSSNCILTPLQQLASYQDILIFQISLYTKAVRSYIATVATYFRMLTYCVDYTNVVLTLTNG